MSRFVSSLFVIVYSLVSWIETFLFVIFLKLDEQHDSKPEVSLLNLNPNAALNSQLPFKSVQVSSHCQLTFDQYV